MTKILTHSEDTMSTQAPANWSQLLEDATRKPGTVAACYRAFHNYSLGNVVLAAW